MKYYSYLIEYIVKDHHTVFTFFGKKDNATIWFDIINLTDSELKEINPKFYEDIDFKNWKIYFETDLWNFLSPKHTFIKTGNYSGDVEYGINRFEFTDKDIMYLKLLQ